MEAGDKIAPLLLDCLFNFTTILFTYCREHSSLCTFILVYTAVEVYTDNTGKFTLKNSPETFKLGKYVILVNSL